MPSTRQILLVDDDGTAKAQQADLRRFAELLGWDR